MKKWICILLAAVILCVGGIAFAQGDTPAPEASPAASGTQGPEEAQDTGNVLEIDNTNLYPGMDRPYSSGYMPTVANGAASIVLPLTARQALMGSRLNVTVDLGDAASSPFVFQNYDKTISLQEHSVNNDTAKAKAYLISLSLPLTDGRANGRYPVTLNVQGQTESGMPFMQSFTLYVTITDGTDPNATPAPEPVPEEQEPAPQPKAMISGYSVNPSPVLAGQEFDLSVTLKNTNGSQPMRNVKVTVGGETADVVPMGETNSFYFRRIGAEEAVTVSTKMLVQQTAEPAPQKILLHIEYEGDKQTAYTSDESIVIQVKQPIRIEFDEPEIPEQVNAGDTLSIPMNVMNMGRGTVYNVRAELAAPGLVPEGSLFLGNLESGAAKKGDLYVFVGTLESEDGTDARYGLTSGSITLTYEDEFGEAEVQEITFSTNINPPVINAPVEEEEEEPQTQSQWWISVILAGAAVGVILGVLYVRKRRQRKAEEDEDA